MDDLARLAAIEEIKDLKARYLRFVDTRDFAGLADVLCADASFDTTEASQVTPVGGATVGRAGPIVTGRDAVVGMIRGALETVTSTHHGHCHEVTIDSDTEAHGIVAMEDVLRGLDRKTHVLHGLGHYHERYRFEDGAWRIATIKLTRLALDPQPAGA